MAQKKKWVAFKSNATIPAGVLGAEENRKVNVGEPIQLPEGYADHVVQDGFATFCDAPKKKPAAKKPTGGNADAIKAAQKRVDDAQVALDKAEGTDGAEAARGELLAAQKALAALQPST